MVGSHLNCSTLECSERETVEIQKPFVRVAETTKNFNCLALASGTLPGTIWQKADNKQADSQSPFPPSLYIKRQSSMSLST